MPRRRFDAVLIDFYGTISAGDRDAVEAACGRIVESCGLTISAEEFAVLWGEQFFQVIERSNHDAFQTLYECEIASLRTTLAAFGLDPDPRPLVAELEVYWAEPPLYPDAIEFLAKLDLPVCCVSNADTKPLLSAIERHALRFDAVVTSETARCYKPDAGIFRRAVAALGADARRTVHIGDSLHSDIGGASKLGIATAWIRRENRIHDIGSCRSDFIIGSLTQAYEIVHG